MLLPKSPRRIHFSPLRYPGGKSVLVELIARTIKANNIQSVSYVEPFAGGAGAALGLLLTEQVSDILINDLDRSVYNFWISILYESERFIHNVFSIDLTIEEWKRQKEIYRTSTDSFDCGFAAFFLNRTNRSGIFNAGPIGGMAQEGDWKLDARFNRKALAERIELIARYRDRIRVANDEGRILIKKYSQQKNTLLFVDPPYYEKGSSLYLNAYCSDDHIELGSVLNSLSATKWILTYDNVPPIRRIYQERKNQFDVSLHYQAHARKMGSEVIVFSDTLSLPDFRQ